MIGSAFETRSVEEGFSVWEVKAVARPSIGNQEAGLGRIGFDLLAKAVDKDPQIFQFVAIVRAPNRLQQFAMGHGLVSLAALSVHSGPP